MKHTSFSGKRRNFLLAAGAGSAVVVGAVAVGEKAPEPVPVAASQKARVGYHETDHIRQYYDSARV